jgi:hypothetical protein
MAGETRSQNPPVECLPKPDASTVSWNNPDRAFEMSG